MISVIIVVKNDRELENTLNSLMKIKKPEKTEIIVIDASKKKILLDIKKRFPKVRWFYYHNLTRKKITIPEQRNFGIKKSRGAVVVFIDAGCTVKKSWLINLTKPIINNEEMVTSGMTKSLHKKSIHNQSWIKRNTKYLPEAGAANLALQKKILKTNLFFDETLEAGEDFDFSWNLIKQGYKIRYTPNAIMYHDEGGIISEIKRSIKYAESKVNLYKKHSDKAYYLLRYNKDLFTLYSIIFFIYIIFLIPITILWHYYPLFLLAPIIKNLRNNPLRKIFFDFFWGFGVTKRLFEVLIIRK